jgi:protein tyrosine/serine phosphatase
LTAAAQQAEPRYEELPNFHRVDEQLYRGGQPKKGGLKILATLGIKTIVNLRGESDDTREEEAEAVGLGMRYINIPMSSAGRPSDEQVNRALGIVDETKDGPVFIHCRRGSDRTGAVIAIYRIVHDGWTAKQAIDEANRYGMGFIQFKKRDYIKDYYEKQQPVRAGK